jgi:hypothetical protein
MFLKRQQNLVTPDIIVAKQPIQDQIINAHDTIIEVADDLAHFTPLRASNTSSLSLHASVSCKWTLRSDRSQNARTEGLNLIRNRKGHAPHIVVVTAEPLPTRIASLALGTGDVDCVYHFALHELQKAVQSLSQDGQLDMLETLINGKRLRDISDLPFDLAI